VGSCSAKRCRGDRSVLVGVDTEHNVTLQAHDLMITAGNYPPVVV